MMRIKSYGNSQLWEGKMVQAPGETIWHDPVKVTVSTLYNQKILHIYKKFYTYLCDEPKYFCIYFLNIHKDIVYYSKKTTVTGNRTDIL